MTHADHISYLMRKMTEVNEYVDRKQQELQEYKHRQFAELDDYSKRYLGHSIYSKSTHETTVREEPNPLLALPVSTMRI